MSGLELDIYAESNVPTLSLLGACSGQPRAQIGLFVQPVLRMMCV